MLLNRSYINLQCLNGQKPTC